MPRRSAYTLLELLLVVALVGILAALAVPTMQTVYADVRARAAADTVRAAWAEALSRAVNEGRTYRFSLVLDHGNFRVAPDSPEYWSGNSPVTTTDPSNPVYVQDDALPKGVRFRTVEALAAPVTESDESSRLPAESIDPGSWSGMILFLPDGSVRTEQEYVEVGIRAPAAQPLVLRMRTLTGVVAIRPFRSQQQGGQP